MVELTLFLQQNKKKMSVLYNFVDDLAEHLKIEYYMMKKKEPKENLL